MKSSILIVILVLFLACFSCKAQTNNTVFTYRNTVYEVVNNKIHVYPNYFASGNPEWQYEFDFTLPNRYKSIFAYSRPMGNVIGINTDNKVLFYFNQTENQRNDWELKLDWEFTLPNGSKSLLFVEGSSLSDEIFPRIGVHTNNTVRFYEYSERGWQQVQERWAVDFDLPSGYKSVFAYPGAVAVQKDNEIQFYLFRGNAWELSMIDSFLLPDGYKSIIGLDTFIMYARFIFVLVDNSILAYSYSFTTRSWELVPDFVFPLSGR
jgi:hypothetical protein